MDSQDTPAVTAANKGRNSGVAAAEAHAGTSEVFLTGTTRSKMIGRKDARETTPLANQIVPVGVCSGQVATTPAPRHELTLPHSYVKTHTFRDDSVDSKSVLFVIWSLRPYIHVQYHTTLNAKPAP